MDLDWDEREERTEQMLPPMPDPHKRERVAAYLRTLRQMRLGATRAERREIDQAIERELHEQRRLHPRHRSTR